MQAADGSRLQGCHPHQSACHPFPPLRVSGYPECTHLRVCTGMGMELVRGASPSIPVSPGRTYVCMYVCMYLCMCACAVGICAQEAKRHPLRTGPMAHNKTGGSEY